MAETLWRDKRVCKTTDSQMQMILELHEDVPYYGIDLPL